MLVRYTILDSTRYTVLDSTNVRKIVISPSSVIFLILHKFKTFCLLEVLFARFFGIFDF